MTETIILTDANADKIAALAKLNGKDEQTVFEEMLGKGLEAMNERSQQITISVCGDVAGRLETLASLYEVDNNSMADRLLRLGIDALDTADRIPE